MPAQSASTFDQVIAAWPDRVACEMSTKRGPRCQRAASWVVNLHGCEHVLMCGQHLAAWVDEINSQRLGDPRCVHCGRVFACASDAFTVTAL